MRAGMRTGVGRAAIAGELECADWQGCQYPADRVPGTNSLSNSS